MRQGIASGALLTTLCLRGASALAQESPADVARRGLIVQAEAAAAAGDHAQAVQLAERAARLRVTPTIQYFLAREHLTLNHPVEALGYSGACARAAEADVTLRNRDGVLQACRAIVTESEARVGRVTVRVPSPPPQGLVVRVQQVELSATLHDVPYPVLPGAVVVEASAPGHLPFRREVQVAASQTEPVEVRLEAEPAVAEPVPAVAPPVALPPTVPAVAPPVVPAPRGASVGPWIVAGSGVVALALGGVFFGLASGERSDRMAACDVHGLNCSPEALTHDRRYESYLTATNVALAVGAAAVLGGATWFIVDRLTHRGEGRATLRWGVSPLASGLTLGLGGRF